MDFAEALADVRAAEAAGVRHMTAFTYRFVPAMRYMDHLVDATATSARRTTSAPSASRTGATAPSAGGR